MRMPGRDALRRAGDVEELIFRKVARQRLHLGREEAKHIVFDDGQPMLDGDLRNLPAPLVGHEGRRRILKRRNAVERRRVAGAAAPRRATSGTMPSRSSATVRSRKMQMAGEVGDPGVSELFDENLVAGLRQRHQRQQNCVLAAAGDDDAIDRRIETGPADPRRSRGAIVPGPGMMLIPEYPRAGRSRNRRGKTIGELLHIRKRHQRVDGEIEHSLLGPFDLHRAGPDERAAPHLAAQQAAALRFDVRARHGRQRDAELACEDALGRQAAAGLQPAGFDLAADRVGNGLIDRAASLPPRRAALLSCMQYVT